MPDTFWERTQRFHERAYRESPSVVLGIEAIQSLRETLGPDWEPDAKHPLRMKLQIACEENYKWLMHYVRKLKELSQIGGHEDVLKRLRGSKTYVSALSEMEFALKLKLNGYSCKFVPVKNDPTPDLVAELENQEVDIEITSLSLPYEDTVGMDALSIVTILASQANCVSGGLYSRVPKSRELEEIRRKAEGGIAIAKSEHKKVDLNIPGLLMCHIAPNDLASEIPAAWRGSFVMRTKSPTPKKDRLAHTIEEKVKAQLSGTNSGVLVVYDRLSTPEGSERMSTEQEIELVVGAFKNLAGVVLVQPFNSWDSPPPKREDKNGRTFVEYSLPDGECERCVIWKNIMVDHRSVIEQIIECLTSSPANLNKLFA